MNANMKISARRAFFQVKCPHIGNATVGFYSSQNPMLMRLRLVQARRGLFEGRLWEGPRFASSIAGAEKVAVLEV